MSSVICFDLDQSKILSSGIWLRLDENLSGDHFNILHELKICVPNLEKQASDLNTSFINVNNFET